MTLVRYNNRPSYKSPVWNRFFDELLDNEVGNSFVPKVDIAENDKSFEMHLALPGMSKDEFNIDLKEGALVISGERKFKDEKENKNFKSIETHYGSFNRSFQLPDNILENEIEATYKDGILAVIIPKDEKKLAARTIKIK